MAIRGIRGAVVAKENSPEGIQVATQELLDCILMANPSLVIDDLCSVIFTVTDDLDADYPAHAARKLGWRSVPMLCAKEIPVPGSLPYCIRVLLHWNTELPQSVIQHIYLGEAARLRPDLQPSG